MSKHSVYFFLLIFSVIISFAFAWKPQKDISQEQGLFFCYINGKPYSVDSVKANFRKITGGETQLSLNNARFVKFTFLNPSTKNINLEVADKREAFIRYEDPASSLVGIPVRGFVNISNLDEKNKVLSGDFEMELIMKVGGKDKTIKVTQGKMVNIPIVFK